MTDLQQVEFDMLKTVTELCDKLNITYYMVCGSALGTVKYHGFIPWDDDVDIGIPRADYNRFLIEAKPLLLPHLFLQNHHSDVPYPMIYTKLRNSNTTYIEKSVAKLPINHGVYIDIFPLDFYPKKKFAQKILEIKKWMYYRMAATVFDAKRSRGGKLLYKFNLMLGFDRKTEAIVSKYEKAISQYKGERSDIICNHGNWQKKLEYAPKEQYGNGAWAEFEGLRVRIPENYDAYLTQKYGDWRADLPEDQKKGHHYFEICDLAHPYTDYTKKVHDER